MSHPHYTHNMEIQVLVIVERSEVVYVPLFLSSVNIHSSTCTSTLDCGFDAYISFSLWFSSSVSSVISIRLGNELVCKYHFWALYFDSKHEVSYNILRECVPWSSDLLQYMSVEVHVVEDNVVSGCICVSEVAAYLVHLHGARERE